MQTQLEPTTDKSASLSTGAPLEVEPARLESLSAALQRAAQVSPNLGVRYLRADGTDRLQTYGELVEEAARVLGGLRAAGLRPGDKAIFQLNLNEDFVPAFWACVFGGFVPVPITIPSGYDQQNNILAKLQNAWTMLDRPVVLAGEALAAGLEGFGRRQGLDGFKVLPLAPLKAAAPAMDWHVNAPDDLTLLLLTSGSTGMPKGVQLTHRNILSRSAATVQFDAFGPRDVSLNWMPLDHVGGLVMFHIRDVFAACSQIQAPTDVVLQNPLVWLDWVNKYRVSITWAPNFAFGLVNDQAGAIAHGKWDLSSMRFILNGGEAIVSKTARRFLTLLEPHGLPGTAMRPAWGMSETSSGVTSSHEFTVPMTADTDPFVEVGGPLPGTSLRIVDSRGQLVAENRVGSLQVKGPTVTAGYYRNPKLNEEVFTKDGWFITGDLGVLKEGRLTITGREKDVIIVNGVNFHSHEIEAVVEEVPGVEVSFAAACAVRLPGEDTDRIAIFVSVTPEAKADLPGLVKAIRAAVVNQEGVNPDFVIPVSKEEIPKTAIGKIQRTQLRQQFERGEYSDVARKYSSQGGELSLTPEWFYRPAWREAGIASANIPAGSSFLLLADPSGLAAAVREQLTSRGFTCVTVEAGTAFVDHGENRYSVSPGNPEDYVKLIGQLKQSPNYVVHAWTYGDEVEPRDVKELEAAQAKGAYSLLGLIKALAQFGAEERTLKILVTSSRVRATSKEDRISFAKTPIVGLVRTFPQELAWLDCRHVDVESTSVETSAKHVLAELAAWDKATESAWRGEVRKVPFLEKAGPTEKPVPLPFKRGGLYVVSGGIGGIGLRFCSHLLQHFDARLLILGRTPLPPRAEWESALKAGGRAAERIRACQSLDVLGGEFEYVALDVADEPALRRALTRVEDKWQRKMDGVFHLAGIYHEALLVNESIEGLASVMRPKVSGAWALHQLAKERPGCLFISFSSLISFFGSLSTGSYAAANNFLDAFSDYQRNECGLRAYNLLWSSWTDIGMSRGYDAGEALRSRGYLPIAPEQGVESLLYALRYDHPQLLMGIDGANKTIQRYIQADPDAVSPSVTTVDANNYIAPRTEVERQMAKIWEGILGVPRVGLKDNFFELGGRSLLAAKMFAQINKALGKNLPIPALFKAPTIEQLAVVFLEQAKSSLVKINVLQVGAARAPLFMIPPAGVDGSVFQEIVPTIGVEQPVFGLQARALASEFASGRPVSIEETAKAFAVEIASIAPSGPVCIGGRGMGGVLAWETARQLLAQKRAINLLALVDPLPAAFFAAEGGNAGKGYRFIKPAAPASGLFGKLFKKGVPSESGVSKEMRETRERYGDAMLTPLAVPVALFCNSDVTTPWRDLASSGANVRPITELAAFVAAVTAK